MGANPRPWLIVVAFIVVFMGVFFMIKFNFPFAPSLSSRASHAQEEARAAAIG